MNYLELMKERLLGNEKYVPSHLGAKRAVREFAASLGVRTPEVYYEGSLDGLSLDSLPQYFVVKPSFASTSIGVHLLYQNPEGSLTRANTGEETTWDDVVTNLREVAVRYFSSPDKGTFIVEELLVGHNGEFPPPDLRAYTFFGEVGMIQIDDHLTSAEARSMYFDGEFQPFDDLAERYGVAEQASHWQTILPAVRPPHWEAALEIFKRISLAVPTAMCRVDTYDTPSGIVLGEITFYPGTFYYQDSKLMLPKESERLGSLWTAAQTRLVKAQVVNLRPR